jgi:hypothetical protein
MLGCCEDAKVRLAAIVALLYPTHQAEKTAALVCFLSVVCCEDAKVQLAAIVALLYPTDQAEKTVLLSASLCIFLVNIPDCPLPPHVQSLMLGCCEDAKVQLAAIVALLYPTHQAEITLLLSVFSLFLLFLSGYHLICPCSIAIPLPLTYMHTWDTW